MNISLNEHELRLATNRAEAAGVSLPTFIAQCVRRFGKETLAALQEEDAKVAEFVTEMAKLKESASRHLN